jgi:hypothetical protein
MVGRSPVSHHAGGRTTRFRERSTISRSSDRSRRSWTATGIASEGHECLQKRNGQRKRTLNPIYFLVKRKMSGKILATGEEPPPTLRVEGAFAESSGYFGGLSSRRRMRLSNLSLEPSQSVAPQRRPARRGGRPRRLASWCHSGQRGLRLRQPEPHAHLAVHRGSGDEMLLGLRVVARAHPRPAARALRPPAAHPHGARGRREPAVFYHRR